MKTHRGVPDCGIMLYSGRRTVPLGWCEHENFALLHIKKHYFKIWHFSTLTMLLVKLGLRVTNPHFLWKILSQIISIHSGSINCPPPSDTCDDKLICMLSSNIRIECVNLFSKLHGTLFEDAKTTVCIILCSCWQLCQYNFEIIVRAFLFCLCVHTLWD